MFDFLKKFASYGKIEGYPVKLADEFIFSVPADYSHSRQIEAFLKYAEKNHIECSHELSDKNFENVSYELEPGEEYRARVFRVGLHPDHPSHHYHQAYISTRSYHHIQNIKTYDCINFLEKQNSMYIGGHFVGAQGLTYAWQFIEKQNLKDGSPVLAMDEIENIIKNGERVAALSVDSGEAEHAVVSFTYNGKWNPGIYLLYINKITETTKHYLNKSGIRIHDHNEIVYTPEKNDGTENGNSVLTSPEEYIEEESIEEIDLDKLETIDINYACELLELGIDISNHLDKVVDEKSSRLALKIIEADSEFGAYNVAKNISHFSKLNPEIARKLIENNEVYCVADNIDKFIIDNYDEIVCQLISNDVANPIVTSKLLPKVHKKTAIQLIENDSSSDLIENINQFEDLDQVIAERLIEKDECDSVLENIDKFSIIDESRLALKIIDSDPSLGAFTVVQSLDNFINLSEDVAVRLIECGETDCVLENIEKFSIIDNSRLVLKIIDSDSSLGAFVVTQDLDKFTNLNQKVAECLIEKDECDSVLENIDKFSIEDESRLALKIINCDSDGTYLIVDNLFKFKNLNKQVVSEIIKNETSLHKSLTLSQELNLNLGSFTKEAKDFIKETYPITK